MSSYKKNKEKRKKKQGNERLQQTSQFLIK